MGDVEEEAAGGGGSTSERYFCPYPGCKRSFAELWRLKVHYRAPPDIRGSGKERGHGTELSHCPKCGKGLKPGKHHVGCSGGKASARQSKRSRLAQGSNAAAAAASAGAATGMAVDSMAASVYGTSAGQQLLQMQFDQAVAAGGYASGYHQQQQQYYAAQHYPGADLSGAMYGQQAASTQDMVGGYLQPQVQALQQQQQLQQQQSPSLSMGVMPEQLGAPGAATAPSLAPMGSGGPDSLLVAAAQGGHYYQQSALGQQPLGLDASGMLTAQQPHLQDGLMSAASFGMTATTAFLVQQQQQAGADAALMPPPQPVHALQQQQHAMMAAAAGGVVQEQQLQHVKQEVHSGSGGGLPPLPSGTTAAAAQHQQPGPPPGPPPGQPHHHQQQPQHISSSLFDDIDGLEHHHARAPSPPPLPPDFPAALPHSGTLFNFAQFSQTRMPAAAGPSQQMAMMPRGMEQELPPRMDELWTPEATYDHHSDGDLMQLLFGAPEQPPTMATIHLHHFLEDDACSDPGLLGLLGGSMDDLHAMDSAAAAAGGGGGAAPAAPPAAAAAGGGGAAPAGGSTQQQVKQQQASGAMPPPPAVAKPLNGSSCLMAPAGLPNGQCGQQAALQVHMSVSVNVHQPAPSAGGSGSTKGLVAVKSEDDTLLLQQRAAVPAAPLQGAMASRAN